MIGWRPLTDTELIFLVLAAMYLWECVCWLPGEAVCLSSAWGRYKFLRSLPLFQSERGRSVLASPAPFASSFICEPWPIVMDPNVILISADHRERTEQSSQARTLAYEEIRSVSRQGRTVLINGTATAKLATEAHAEFVAGKLSEIRDAEDGQRAEVIEAIFDAMTDMKAISMRIGTFEQMILPLKVICTLFTIYAIVVGPGLYYGPVSARGETVWLCLGGFCACWLLVVAVFQKVRRTASRQDRRTQFWCLAPLSLSPASAMRTAAGLSLDWLAGKEPLAVAAVLCSKDEFAEYAQITLRTVLYPIIAEPSRTNAAVVKAHSWFTDQREVCFKRIVRNAGLELDALLPEPSPDSDASSYCPRCLMQYASAEGRCSECRGVSLAPFVKKSEFRK